MTGRYDKVPKSADELREIARRGEEILAGLVGRIVPTDHGRFAAVDVETGDFRVGDDYAALSRELHQANPGARVYVSRIGSRAAGRIGGRLRPARP